jgi:hypothetical protein
VAAYVDETSGEGSKEEGSEHKDVLSEALARFRLTEEAEDKNRKAALDDIKFLAGEQWDQRIKEARAAKGRPCFVINRLQQHAKQVVNDLRQNRPSIKVHPVDDKADVDTAKIYQGIIRHIEYNSNADAAYDTAGEGAVRGGRGFWRVVTEYVSPLSFEQEILIKRIRNPFSVYFDPHSKEPDGSDANFAFVVENISKEAYERRYPKSKLAGVAEWESSDANAPGWLSSDSCRIAEYFYKAYEEKEIVQLSNGQTVLAGDLDSKTLKQLALAGVKEVRRRTTSVPTVKWCKLTSSEILDETEWLGSYIPIVPVYGEELDIEGERILKGIARDAKDPQRLINYWKSAEAEAIALAPKAPFIAAKGQVEKYAADWKSANTENHAVLMYDPVSVNGTPVPPPQRQNLEPAIQAITMAAMNSADDLKSTTGLYDAALGARSNETSGKAITARANQAQTSNYHFADNLTRSQKHTGRILIELIPKIYDSARAARILGEDGEPEIIKINQEFERNGKVVHYDLSKGKYDCTVDVGPSYATKRQEAVANMVEMSRNVPILSQVAPDLIVKNMDWPGAQELAERLKKAVPPQFLDDQNKESQAIPPQIQAQMAQMQQMLEQADADRKGLLSEREQKLLEHEHEERMLRLKLETELEIERAKIDQKDSLALLSAQIDEINQGLQLRQAQPEPQQPDPMQSSAGMHPQASPYDTPEDFAQPALEQGAPQDPTGGISPGLPMEQSSDDPNSL